MISRQMRKTLQEIKKQQEKQGVAVAPQINVYKDRTTLYRSLRKLEKIEAIQTQEAPKTRPENKTYTITQFGKKFLEKTETIQTK